MARSDSFQHLFKEIGMDNRQLSQYAAPEAEMIIEGLDELKQELISHLFSLINSKLTLRQREVLLYYLDGLPQSQIAAKYGIHQTAIQKSLYGNQYIYGSNPKYYGGIFHKLKKYAARDQNIQLTLNQIKQLKNPDMPITPTKTLPPKLTKPLSHPPRVRISSLLISGLSTQKYNLNTKTDRIVFNVGGKYIFGVYDIETACEKIQEYAQEIGLTDE